MLVGTIGAILVLLLGVGGGLWCRRIVISLTCKRHLGSSLPLGVLLLVSLFRSKAPVRVFLHPLHDPPWNHALVRLLV